MSDDRETLDGLLEIVRAYDLDALTVRSGGATFEIVARVPAPAVVATTVASDGAAHPPSAGVAVPVQPPANIKKIVAPIIGVFYRSAAPGADVFVNVGDHVEAGHVVCILEAMKLMNEITSDHAGIVRRILPENGALVSLGEELVWIEP